MKYVIVTRHKAAEEFIRANAPEFATAPCFEAVEPHQIRGAIVAGNLPLHLAALCAQVVAVEFSGPPPRGTEYTAADMAAAGAALRRYTVSRVADPAQEIGFNDGRKSRGYRDRLFVGMGEQIREFTGESIPGIAAVVNHEYSQNGKWSNSTFRLILAPGAWSYKSEQDWETGERFHGCPRWGAVISEFRKAGCAAPDSEIVRFVRVTLPKTGERVDKSEADLASVGA